MILSLSSSLLLTVGLFVVRVATAPRGVRADERGDDVIIPLPASDEGHQIEQHLSTAPHLSQHARVLSAATLCSRQHVALNDY